MVIRSADVLFQRTNIADQLLRWADFLPFTPIETFVLTVMNVPVTGFRRYRTPGP